MASRSSKKDRLKRSIPTAILVCLVIFGAGILILIDSVSPGRIDAQATARLLTLCAKKTTCTVRLGDIIPGSWDTFFEFAPTVPQDQVRKFTGDDQLHTAHSQRILVLKGSDRVLRRQYAHTGQYQPMAGEIVFANLGTGPHTGWVSYPRDTAFQVTQCPTKEGGSPLGLRGGTYYLLTPGNAPLASAVPCPLP